MSRARELVSPIEFTCYPYKVYKIRHDSVCPLRSSRIKLSTGVPQVRRSCKFYFLAVFAVTLLGTKCLASAITQGKLRLWFLFFYPLPGSPVIAFSYVVAACFLACV